MLSPEQVIQSEYLESRCALLEIAAMLDRYDIAVERTGADPAPVKEIELLTEAFELLAKPSTSASSANRAEQLLNLFAKA